MEDNAELVDASAALDHAWENFRMPQYQAVTAFELGNLLAAHLST